MHTEKAESGQETADSHWLRGKRGEQVVFILLAVVMWPAIAVVAVGAYGFLIWIYQMIAGPPGPPGM